MIKVVAFPIVGIIGYRQDSCTQNETGPSRLNSQQVERSPSVQHAESSTIHYPIHQFINSSTNVTKAEF